MKKVLAIILGLLFPIVVFATGPTSATSTSWTTGSTLSSAWLNAVGTLFGSLNANSFPSSTFAQVANNLSDLTSTSTALINLGLNNLANALQLVAANNLSDLTSSSSARLNIGLNNVSNLLQLVAANNLSDLTNTSSARTNLGLGNVFNAGQLIQGNNLTDLTNTSTARNALGFSSSSQITISATGTLKFATTSVSQFVNDAGYATSGSVSAAGTFGNVQYNNAGTLSASSTFTFASSTGVLTIPTPKSSLLLTNSSGAIGGIGAPANGTGTILSYQNGAWQAGLYTTYFTNTTTTAGGTTASVSVSTTTIPTGTTNSIYDIFLDFGGTDGHNQTSTISLNGNSFCVVNKSISSANALTFYLHITMQNSTSFGQYYQNCNGTSTIGVIAYQPTSLNYANANVNSSANTITTTSSVTMMQ